MQLVYVNVKTVFMKNLSILSSLRLCVIPVVTTIAVRAIVPLVLVAMIPTIMEVLLVVILAAAVAMAAVRVVIGDYIFDDAASPHHQKSVPYFTEKPLA